MAQNIEVHRVSNEKVLAKKRIANHATGFVFWQLLEQCLWKEEKFEDAKSLISRAVENIQALKNKSLTPIMFVGNRDVLKFIHSLRRQDGRKEEKLPFDISRESNKSDEIYDHIDGIEIYNIFFIEENLNLLLCKESFKKIKIKHFGDAKDERYVDVTFTTTSPDAHRNIIICVWD